MMDSLRLKFDADYRTLKDLSVHLPRIPHDITPAHVPIVADACAQVRELSCTAGNIECRWLRVSQEVSTEFQARERAYKEKEKQKLVEMQPKMKELNLKTGDERKEYAAQTLAPERADLEVVQRFQEESKTWHAYAKRRYEQMQDAREDCLNMLSLMKQAIMSRGFDGSVAGVRGNGARVPGARTEQGYEPEPSGVEELLGSSSTEPVVTPPVITPPPQASCVSAAAGAPVEGTVQDNEEEGYTPFA